MGLRPITAILETVGVPVHVTVPKAGDRAMAQYNGIDIPIPGADDNITDPKINIEHISNDFITIPDIKLDNNISTDNITVPNLKLNESKGSVNIPNTKLQEMKNVGVTVPNNKLTELSNAEVKIPTNNITRPSLSSVVIPNIALGKLPNDSITIPDTNIGSVSTNVIKSMENKFNIPDSNLISIPNNILDNTNLNQITIPTIGLSIPSKDRITIPEIALDTLNGGVTIPDIKFGDMIKGVTIPDIKFEKSKGNVTDPKTIIAKSKGKVKIPSIQLDSATFGDDVTIPNIDLNSNSPYNNINNPNTILGTFKINPINKTDNDLILTAFKKSGTKGETTNVPFRFNFDTNTSDLSQFTADKVSKGLDNLYTKGDGVLTDFKGGSHDIHWPNYGHDKPNGGSSNAPYIRRPIGSSWAPYGLDFLTSINRGIQDVVRFGKWATDGPQGLLYLAKQIGLQLSNPKMVTTAAGRAFLPLMQTRLYNPLSVPLQLAGNAIGLHVPRHITLMSRIPASVGNISSYNGLATGATSAGDLQDLNYEWIVNQNNKTYIADDRMLRLFRQLVDQSGPYFNTDETDPKQSALDRLAGFRLPRVLGNKKKSLDQTSISDDNKRNILFNSAEVDQFRQKKNPGEIIIPELSGLMGPKSIFGLGWTNIHTAKKNFKLGWSDKNGIDKLPITHYYNDNDDSATYIYDIIDTWDIKSVLIPNTNDAVFKLGGLGLTDKDKPIMHPDVPILPSYAPSGYIPTGEPLNSQPFDNNIKSKDNIVATNYSQSVFDKLTTNNFGPGDINSTKVINSAYSPIIPNAKEMYQKLVSYNVNYELTSEYGSLDLNTSRGIGSEWTDNHTVNYQTNNTSSNANALIRESYPKESKSGHGMMRSKVIGYYENEGKNGAWPDMHARVGVQRTGVGQYDKLMANENPESFGDLGRDFVRVRFRRAGGQIVTFRAYISGLSDKWSPSWNPTSYVGRPDKVYTYQGVDREISFSLMIVAESHVILNHVYQRINSLATYTMPEFTPAGIMKGPLMSLTIGNLMTDLPGYISSLDFDFSDEYPWDIEVERPMYVKANISYVVINKQMPNAAKKDWYSYSSTANEAWNQRNGTNTNEQITAENFGTTDAAKISMTNGTTDADIK